MFVFIILGAILYLVSFVCDIIILIDAFQNELWKGLLCLVCGFYGLYYMFAEFDHEKKWQVIGGSFGGAILGGICMALGGAFAT